HRRALRSTYIQNTSPFHAEGAELAECYPLSARMGGRRAYPYGRPGSLIFDCSVARLGSAMLMTLIQLLYYLVGWRGGTHVRSTWQSAPA
ncbi:MAG TPA: hypothetical protein VID72_13650, partial [Ktedonobacterales bacterium]